MTGHAQLAYYETGNGLIILCQTCAQRREQQGKTCQWFDTIGDVGQLIDLIQCEDCGDVGLDEDEYAPIYDSIERHSPEWYKVGNYSPWSRFGQDSQDKIPGKIL